MPELFNPPVNRSMTKLDRSFFQKTIPVPAITISDARQISRIRQTLTKTREALSIGGLKAIVDDEANPGAKCLLLDPKVSKDGPAQWSSDLSNLMESGLVSIRTYELKLTYDDFTMGQILEAILPELPDDEKETPTGFSQAGHVAHLNLRSMYLPYKYLIGQVLADKNPQIKTVINKTLDVGTESVYRTFPYEVLSGPDDLNVTVSESGCEFRFDFAKVYWNSRLGTEHERLVTKFKPGEAICDVMAGVGPFALPAGKKHVFVRANDLNPDSYESLTANIVRNKVSPFVLAYCDDGRNFIRAETARLRDTRRTWVKPPPKVSRTAAGGKTALKAKVMPPSSSTASPTPPPPPTTTTKSNSSKSETLTEPSTFDHYVMNLPATAIEFLDAFKGVHHGHESDFVPLGPRQLPMIHVYTFQAKRATAQEEIDEVCAKVSRYIGAEVKLDDEDLAVEVYNVRLVAPQKWMYCASFRLPRSVAFANPSSLSSLSSS